jgi:hypothetical protein
MLFPFAPRSVGPSAPEEKRVSASPNHHFHRVVGLMRLDVCFSILLFGINI